MFGLGKRARFYQQYLKAAKTVFKDIPRSKSKEISPEISGALSSAISAGVDVLLRGLRDDLTTTIAGDSDDMDQNIQESLNMFGRALSELIKVRNMKSGDAHWLHFAVKGEDEPKSEQTGDFVWINNSLGSQAEPKEKADSKAADPTPVWLRGDE